MRRLFKNRIFTVALALIVVLLSGSALVYFLTDSASLPHKIAGTVLSPLQRLMTGARTGISGFVDARTKYDELLAENEELRAKLREMEETVRNAEIYKQENEDLRRLLGMREKNPEMELVPALVIAWNDTAWSSVFTINKGTKHGIAVNDTVLTEDGFAGIVTKAEADFCEVSAVSDTKISLGASVARTGVVAVAKGDFELMKDGKLRFSLIAPGSDVKPGDSIATTGSGGLVPPGILIGDVEYVRSEAGGMSDYAVIIPAVNPRELKSVFVVTDFEVEE